MWYPEWHKKEFQKDLFEEEITNSLSQIQIHPNIEDKEDKHTPRCGVFRPEHTFRRSMNISLEYWDYFNV